jgi:hypothetical protein
MSGPGFWRREFSRKGILLTFLLLLFFSGLLPSLHAQTCTEIAGEIRTMTTEAFDEYPLLNLLKQDMLLILYGRERTACPPEIVDLSLGTKEFLTRFDAAYQLSRSPETEARLQSIEEVKAMKRAIQDLRTRVGAEGEGVSQAPLISMDLVLKEFVLKEAEKYQREAERTPITREKIASYYLAFQAYDVAEELPDATRNKIRWASLQEVYTREMAKADEAYTQGLREEKRAESLLSGGVRNRIDAYVSARLSHIHFQEAQIYYRRHQEREKMERTEEKIRSTGSLLRELRKDLAFIFSAVTLLLLALTFYLIHRLTAWSQDNHDCFLGNELVQVKSVEI